MFFLKSIVEQKKVTSFSINKSDNFAKFNLITERLRTYFDLKKIKITMCTGNVTIPEQNKREEIIKTFHANILVGHCGVTAMFQRIRDQYYWKGLRKQVKKLIKFCQKCQERKLVRKRTRQPMRITNTPGKPLSRIQIDYCGPFDPATPKGNRFILTW